MRPCQGIERRLQAAARLGFRRAIVPAGYAGSSISVPDSMVVAEAGDLQGVVAALRRFLADPPRAGGRSSAGKPGPSIPSSWRPRFWRCGPRNGPFGAGAGAVVKS